MRKRIPGHKCRQSCACPNCDVEMAHVFELSNRKDKSAYVEWLTRPLAAGSRRIEMSREALRALAAERGWVEFATVDEQSTLLSIMHRCRDRQRAEAVPSAPDMKVALATRIGKIENRFADLREADRAERTLALLRAQPRPFAEEER